MLEKKLFLLSPNVMSITHSVLLFCVSTFHIQLLQYKMYYSNIPKVDAILVKPSSFCDSKCLVSLIFVLIFVYKENEKLIVLLCKILVFKSVLCYRVFRYKVLRKYHLYNVRALQVTITNWTNYSNQLSFPSNSSFYALFCCVLLMQVVAIPELTLEEIYSYSC